MTNIRKQIRSFAGIFRHLGQGDLGLFVQEVSWRLPNWLLVCRTATQQVAGSVKPLDPTLGGVTCGWAEERDLEDIRRLTQVSLEIAQERMRAGDRCYIARDSKNRQKLLHASWVHRGSCYVRGLGYAFDIEDSSAYVYWVVTHPEARGRNLYRMTLHTLLGTGGGPGEFQKIYVCTEHWNKHACEYHLRIGFEPVTESYLVKVFGVGFLYVKHIDSGKKTLGRIPSPPQGMPVI